MIYTELTAQAMRLAFAAHKEQVDKCGVPYVFHPFHLAEQMTDELSVVVALLHDVVEDSSFTLEDLTKQGFPPEVVEAVELLTRTEGVPYLDYVRALKRNSLARAVKLADLAHNSDPGRAAKNDEAAQARLIKYSRAIEILTEEDCKNRINAYAN